MHKIINIFFILVIALYACEKITSYPPEPKLTYKSHKVEIAKDALGNNVVNFKAVIDFVDGDGDMILPVYSDTVSYSKLFIINYYKEGNVYYPVTDTNYITKPTRLVYANFMNREGQNKIFKGTITKILEFRLIPYDTIKLQFYLFDRAYHMSNIVEISDISLKVK